MNRRTLLVLGTLILGIALGRFLGSDPSPAASLSPFPQPVLAGEIVSGLGVGDTFVTTDGSDAFYWRVTENRLELIGCSRTTKGDDQVLFVWLPGVERRS